MSRIGKQPITIPNGVTVNFSNNTVNVKGPKGELSTKINPRITVEISDNTLTVTRKSDNKTDKSLHGLSRTLVSNMIEGVTKGYEKRLEIIGVGFKSAVSGAKLTLNLGFSHPIEVQAPKGINIAIDQEKKNILIISGFDKQLVGEVAANIRGLKKPEPYKGKGVKFVGEHVARKAGKAAGKDAK